MEIWDATGNHWIPQEYHDVSQLDALTFDGAFWPGESAWKLRFEFSRAAGFEPDELFPFNGMTAPTSSQIIMLENSTNVAGCKLQLAAVTGDQVQQPGDLAGLTVTNLSNISIRVDPKPPDHRLTLVRVTDESGREAETNQGIDFGQPQRVFGFKMPDGAKTLNFTFALHKSRFVEFLARPEFADPGKASKINATEFNAKARRRRDARENLRVGGQAPRKFRIAPLLGLRTTFRFPLCGLRGLCVRHPRPMVQA